MAVGLRGQGGLLSTQGWPSEGEELIMAADALVCAVTCAVLFCPCGLCAVLCAEL